MGLGGGEGGPGSCVSKEEKGEVEVPRRKQSPISRLLKKKGEESRLDEGRL